MTTVLTTMNTILKRPDAIGREVITRAHAGHLLIGSVACYLAYAFAAGFFQGGDAVALAMMKIPIIILASVLLCLPSLYVFTALAGADFTRDTFVTAVAAFCAIAGLILLGLLPVTWLFSITTMSLNFVVWMHAFVWIVALAFARRLLLQIAGPARGAIGLWLVLLFVVSLQMTTYLRPVLWRSSGAPIVELEKKSFFSHLYDVANWRP
jgi:hypothetical protein